MEGSKLNIVISGFIIISICLLGGWISPYALLFAVIAFACVYTRTTHYIRNRKKYRVAHYANKLNIYILDSGWKELPGILAGTQQKFADSEALYADIALCYAFTTLAVELKACEYNKASVQHVLNHCLHIQKQIYELVQTGVILPSNGIACASMITALAAGDDQVINRLVGPFNQHNKLASLIPVDL